MVATRRMVQRDPIEDELASDPEQMLKKKPVRKATAKTAPKAEPATKGRATRGKKTEDEAEPEKMEEVPVKAKRAAGRPKKDAVPVDEVIEATKSTRSTKTAGSMRGRKAAAVVEVEPEQAVVEQPKATRATKAGSLRGRKAAASAVEQDPVLEAPEPAKSTKTGSVRGRKAPAPIENAPSLPAPVAKATRGTRAAAAKAQPLSPKKITQVSKPATRTTRNAKPVKAAPIKAPALNRTTTRKRTVSDENAGVPYSRASSEDEDDDVVEMSSTPAKVKPARIPLHQGPLPEDSEMTLSSRPTTPNDSTLQSLGVEEDDHDEQADAELVSEAGYDVEDDAESTANEEDSADELCGPKTPMKRGSADAEARYLSSVQRTLRKYEEEQGIQTPARRYNVLGSQRGTPQTQKPYRKPDPPSSAVRPMTVARAANRQFVFRDLREGVPSLPERDESVSEEQDEPTVDEHENDELSFVIDDNIIPMNEPETAAEDETPAPPTPIVEAPQQLPSSSLSRSELDEDDEPAETFISHNDNVNEQGFVAPAQVEQDPEETMVLDDTFDGLSESEAEEAHDEDQASQEDAQSEEDLDDSDLPGDSFETDDTVIITRPNRAQVEDQMTQDVAPVIEADNEVEDGPVASSIRFEMKALERKQSPAKHEATITVNFDDLFSGARNVENLGAEDQQADEGATMQLVEENGSFDEDHMEVDVEPNPLSLSTSERLARDSPYRRQTMNFNDFIDMAALAEPTATLSLADLQTQEHQVEQGDEDEASFGAMRSPFTEDGEKGHEETTAIVRAPAATEMAETHAQQDTPIDDTDMFDLDFSQPQPTPAHEQQESEHDPVAAEAKTEPEGSADQVDEEDVPHYALPTIAYDARRKSLPAFSHQTPVQAGSRPSTSDGASMPRIVNAFSDHWWSRSRAASVASTPAKKGMSSVHTMPIASSPKLSPAKTPMTTPGERFPRLAPRQDYEEHAKTVAAPVRFRDINEKPAKRRETIHRATSGRVTAFNPKAKETVETPKAKQVDPTPRATESGPTTPDVAETPVAATAERFPRMNLRNGYAEHAKTVAAPVRFRTPVQTTPLKRPATSQKPESLRKAALKANTPLGSRTPMKTPLKAPATTPGQEPMTPHPAAPLRGVMALVEVFTLEGASASAPFVALLHRLGAKTTKAWSDRVTHVIFKDGSPTTLQRVRLNNKAVGEKSSGNVIHCVNSRWVNDCDTEGTRMDESDEAYAVDVAEIPRGGKRRRKSMEPSALLNIGGNIVRDRKSSGSRISSLGRSLLMNVTESPAKQLDATEAEVTPVKDVSVLDKENSDEEGSSPVTPAWIKEPNLLVQQTAPMDRVRKLDLPGKEKAKSRRLTFWNGGN